MDEIVAIRMALPQWRSVSVSAAAYGLSAWNALDDLGLGFYEWNDLVYPTATVNPLLRSVGRWNTAGTGWQVHTLASLLPVGTDTLGASAVLAVATNYGLIAGGEATDLTIVFDNENPNGTRTWTTLWEDQGREWSDFVLSSLAAEVAEYRTFGVDENSIMVPAAPTTVWPATWDAGTVDDQPRNLPRLRIRLERVGITGDVN